MSHWLLGYPDQALAAMHQALARAQAGASPLTLGWVQLYAAVLHIVRGDVAAVQTHAEAMLTLATTHGLTALAASKLVLEGWVWTAQGQGAAGLAQLRQGLADWQATGQAPARWFFLVLLAEQYGHLGQAEAGLRVLVATLANPAMREQRMWEAELYRVQGALLRVAGRPAEAEPWVQQALAVARRQEAKSLELRAAMELSRLWQPQGKGAAARALLAEVYGRFTEGFDTADLRQAQVLLTALT